MQVETLGSAPTSRNVFHPNPAVLDSLRSQIRQLERGRLLPSQAEPTISLGDPEIDGALPWGGLPVTPFIFLQINVIKRNIFKS